MDNTGTLLLLAAIAILSVMLAWPVLIKRLPGAAKLVKPGQLKAALEAKTPMLILDVRSPEEFKGEMGHIRGALNIPLADLQGRLQELKDQLAPYKKEPIVIVCRTMNRSGQAAKILSKFGFAEIGLLDGGMNRWNDMEFPVSR